MLPISIRFSALCLVAFSLCGCPLLNPFLASPESAFEGSPTTGEAPLTVLFVDASEAGTANIAEWQWDFGDGSTSTSRNPSHIYTMPGTYTVSLTVTTSVGTHTALRRDYIEVVEPPTAEFEATPVLGNAPLTVNFTDMSDPGSSEIIDWQWNFGDRTPTSAEQNPVHIYDAPGLYTVSLTVTTSVGSDTMEKVQYVNVAGNPVADFESNFAPGTAPLSVTFTDASDAGTAAITGWTWDFGDGGMSMEQNPTYVYATPGIYTVSLMIETEVGSDTVTRQNLIVVEEGPTAAFAGDPVMGAAPLSVAFTDQSSAGSMAISNRLWDFGDGGLLSTRQNPTRVYNVPGVYTVSLKVTTPVGSNTLEQADYITVLPGVSFSGNQTSGEGSLTVQFVDQSATGDFEVTAWAWDFGDGGMSTEQNPEHTYTAPGVYDVGLTVTTALGDSMATEAGYITVTPTTAFSAEPTTGAPPLEVTFTDETVPGNFEISAWAWDFGDGGSSEEQSPVYTYETPGIYTVSLETTTENGATQSVRGGLVRVDPVVTIGASATTGQGTLDVDFTDQTEAGNLNILSWFWDFGDGMNSTAQNPSHTYQNIGTYTVSLRVTTALGDTTVTETDLINVGPEVDFSSDVQQGSGMLTVKFTDLTDAGALEITGWMWDFGDGMVSDEQHPTHDYTPGQYSVALTVTTSQGDTTTAKTDLILVAPMVAIDNVQPMGPAPFEASLLDVTMPGNFEITGWNWNFGDGMTSTEQNPVHVFQDPGTYTVTLTITTNGGNFSVTERDFITAQRGPTALFSQSVTRGGDAEDPVTVSFINMSTPGDAPILNQTWEFGASAIFAEEDAEEANPTVTYPGVAFDTIPQDVSLTVRTFIAADTLLKENLYNATGAKRRLSGPELWATELQLLATNGTEDVWVAGTLSTGKSAPDDIVLARLGSDGVQRWAIALETAEPLVVTGLAVSDGGALYVSGTLDTEAGPAVYLAGFDEAGAPLWDRFIVGAGGLYSGALVPLDGDTLALSCRHVEKDGASTLMMITGDLGGESVHASPSVYPAAPGRQILAAAAGSRVHLMTSDGIRYGVQLGVGDAVVTPLLVGAVNGNARSMVLRGDGDYITLARDGQLWLEGPMGAEALGLPEETVHTLKQPRQSDGLELVWVQRNKAAMAWQVAVRPLVGQD